MAGNEQFRKITEIGLMIAPAGAGAVAQDLTVEVTDGSYQDALCEAPNRAIGPSPG